jgi:uncharacterized protein YecE (DUF72 family)
VTPPDWPPDLLAVQGISGARSSYTDDHLQRLRDLVLAAGGDGSAYVLFNNLPRVGDAKRFVKLLRPC